MAGTPRWSCTTAERLPIDCLHGAIRATQRRATEQDAETRVAVCRNFSVDSFVGTTPLHLAGRGQRQETHWWGGGGGFSPRLAQPGRELSWPGPLIKPRHQRWAAAEAQRRAAAEPWQKRSGRRRAGGRRRQRCRGGQRRAGGGRQRRRSNGRWRSAAETQWRQWRSGAVFSRGRSRTPTRG